MLTQTKLPFPFNAINALGETINRLGRTTPRLDSDYIQARACKMTGLSDLGDPHYLVGLKALLEAAQRDELNYFGQLITDTLALEYTKMRLQWMETQKRKPEAFATDLTAPIIVTGLPRSGTTLLHRMLAADPANQSIPHWRLNYPFPPLDGSQDKRYKTMQSRQKIADKLVPDLPAKHKMTPDTPEECMIVQGISLNSFFFYASAPVYSYFDWYESADKYKMYEEYGTILRWYQSLDARRLVMKSPSHVSELQELITALPNALIVQIHRDPVKAVNSFNSLIHTLHSGVMKPYVPAKMVDTNLRAVDMFVRGNLAARDKLENSICDVFYDDLVGEPVKTTQKVYAHFGIEWTDTYHRQLSRYIADNPYGKHGVHQYNSTDFGLTDAQIQERYSDYIRRYSL